MAFMQPQFTEDTLWWEVDGNCGVLTLPCSLFSKEDTISLYDGAPMEVEQISGIGARLSAPGYMDCTEWAVFDTMEEARAYMRDVWEVDPDTGDALDED